MNKPKDFVIFKIRYYADGINVRKGIYSNGSDKQDKEHWERAQAYNKFYWEMVERVTNQSFQYWSTNYFLSSKECANEELFSDFNIYIPETEEYFYWFIPKKYLEVIQWIEGNCPLPFVISKRCSYSVNLNNTKTTWRRNEARKFTQEQLNKK